MIDTNMFFYIKQKVKYQNVFHNIHKHNAHPQANKHVMIQITW